MKKLITTLVTGCLLFWTSILIAQPTFTFSPSDTSGNPGDQLTFEVSITDFTDILSFQYSMNWDPDVLDFVSVDNITSDLASFAASSFGTTQVDDGKLSVNWFDPNVSGVSLTNGTILYTLTFDVLSTDGTDLAFTGDPTVIEIVDSNGDDIGMNAENAAINGGSPGGGGGGGGNSSDLILTASQVNAANGDQICLDVSVENFTNILSMQYSMNFNQNVIEYTGVSNLNLQDLAPSNFGTTMTNNGILTLSWFDNTNASGVTVPNGTVIFQVCFDVIGSMGQNSSFDFTNNPTVIEVFDGDSNPVPVSSNSGAVNVTSGGGTTNPNGLIVSAPVVSGNQGTNICLDVSVENFDDILSMQFSMNFDETVLQYTGVSNLNLQDLAPSNFGTTMTDDGVLTLSWFDNTNASGVTVPDGTVIFQVCFDIIGSNGENSPFNFTSNPTVIEVFDGDSNPVDFSGNNGSVTVGDGGNPPPPPSDDGLINATDHYPLEDEEFCMDIYVSDFIDILSMQFSMNFDPNELEFQEVVLTGNLPDLLSSAINTNGADMGEISLAWFDQTTEGVTLDDGTVIFQLCFKVLGSCGTVTNLDFTDEPVPIEIIDADENEVTFTSNPGVVDICGSPPLPSVTVSASDYQADEDEEFCIDIDVSDFDNIASMAYSMNFDASKLEFQSIQLTNNLTGLDISDFDIGSAANGALTLNWQEASGITVADGTTIYQVCFKSLAACGTASSSFEFTDSPVAIALTDGDGNAVDLTSNEGTISSCSIVNPPTPADEFIVASDHTPQEGEDFCMDISVNDFDNIVSMQYSMSFDPNELEFQSVEVTGNLNGLAVSNFGVNDAGNGVLTVSWLDPDVAGITLADGTVIYQVCFKVLGSCGTVTNFEFTNSPTVIEVTDGNGNIVNIDSNPGVVDICGDGTPPPPPAADEFIVASDHTPQEGEEFCMDISVNDFDNIVSMQYSMSFDPSELEFQSVQVTGNLNGLAASNFGVNDAGNGVLTVSWLDPDVAGITLADGTIIYQVCFKVLGSCGTVTNFEFTDSPTVIEVTDGNGNIVNFDSNPGIVDICGTTPTPSVTVSASDYQADEDEEFCIDIDLSNFDNIASMAYSMNFDASKLEFQSIQLTNNLTGLDISDFDIGSAANGTLTLNWQEASGVTVANGTTIFQVCFKSLAACGTASSSFEFTNSPVAIALTDGDGNPVNMIANDGQISFCSVVNPPPPPADEFIVASDHTPQEGEEFCMDISVNDFDNIVSMQYSMSFDPNELEFQSVQVTGNLNGLAASNFGVNDAGNGVLTVSWLDPDVAGITLADGTVIYQVCFKVLGSCGTVTNFEFTDSPTVIEVTDGDGNIVDFSSDPGIVDICGAPAIPFILTAAQDDVPAGETICIPISVQGFEDIVSMQYSMTFDPNVIQFTGTQNYGLNGLSASSFGVNNAANGVITFSWLDPDAIGITVADGTVIYEICFEAVGDVGDASSITFTDSPTTIEIGKPNGTITPSLNNGSATILDGCPGDIIYESNQTVIQNVDCNGGTDGVIDITISGGDGNYNYEWRNTSGTIVSTAPNYVGGAGTFTLTVTSCGDNVSFSETFTVTEPDPIDVTVNVTDVDCFGEETGFIMTDPSGGTPVYNYSWSNGGGNISQFNLGGGTYSFTLTDGNGCQFISDQIDISEPTELTASASVVDPPCFGDEGSVTISANGGVPGYEYSLDNGNTYQAASFFSDVAEGTYTALVRDDNGCVTTITPSVVVDAPDELNITLTSTFDSGNCIGSAAVQVSGGNTITDYFWSGPNTTYFNTPNQSGLCAGQHCVIVQDINGCQTSECVYVSRPLVVAGNVTNACWGINNGEIAVVAQGGVPPNPTYTYSWDPQVPNPGSPNQTGLAPGTYCVTVTSMPDNQMETMCFNVVQALDPVQIGNANLNDPTGPNLFNGSIQISGVTGGFGGPYTYKWNPNLSTGSVLNNLDEGTYNLTVCDVNGCNISASYVLEIVPTDLQFSTFDFEDAKCSDTDDGTFTFSVSGGLPTYAVTVDGPTGQVYSNPSLSENQVITINNLPPGNYTISAEYNVSGYTGSIDANFTINAPAPLVLESLKIQNATEAPAPGRIFIDIEGGDAPYTYFWNNASTSKDLFDIQPGPYSTTVTDQAGCTAEFGPFEVKLFHVDGAATVNVDCPNDETGSITPNIVNVAGDPVCEWVGPNGEIFNTCDISNLPAGTYTLVVTDSCDVETPEYEFEISANSDISVVATPTTNNNGVNISCFGGSDGGATATVTGGVPPFDFIWSNGDPTQEITGVPAGLYSVTVIDAIGCEDDASTSLTQPTQPLEAEIAGVVSPSCFGAQNGSVTITVSGGTPFPGANPYLYQWNDSQNQTGPTAILLRAGNYQCTVTDRNGCQVVVPVTMTDPERMTVVISTTCDNGEADGTALAQLDGGTGPYQFTWSNGDTAQFITDLTAGTYFVEVVDANGCQATDIDGGFVCPNFGCFEARTVITPDGDGRNEEFIIGCTSRFPNNKLEIFNRWGQLVFETDDYVCEEASLDGCWLGTNARGEDLPEGVYFYIFDYTDPVTNEEDQKRGSVTVLRQ